MNTIFQTIGFINQQRIALKLEPIRLDHRLTRAALYWSALCQGRNSWKTQFADLEPWNAVESAPLEYNNAWVLVSTTPPSIIQSVEQWFKAGNERAALTELPSVGIAVFQGRQNWHWIIYSANPKQHKQIGW